MKLKPIPVMIKFKYIKCSETSLYSGLDKEGINMIVNNV